VSQEEKPLRISFLTHATPKKQNMSDPEGDRFMNMNMQQRVRLMRKLCGICDFHIPSSQFRGHFAAFIANIPVEYQNGHHILFVLRDGLRGHPRFQFGDEEKFFREIARAICGDEDPAQTNKTYVSYAHQQYSTEYLTWFEWKLGRFSFVFHHPTYTEVAELNTFFAWIFEVNTPEEADMRSVADTESSDEDPVDWGDSLRKFRHVTESGNSGPPPTA